MDDVFMVKISDQVQELHHNLMDLFIRKGMAAGKEQLLDRYAGHIFQHKKIAAAFVDNPQQLRHSRVPEHRKNHRFKMIFACVLFFHRIVETFEHHKLAACGSGGKTAAVPALAEAFFQLVALKAAAYISFWKKEHLGLFPGSAAGRAEFCVVRQFLSAACADGAAVHLSTAFQTEFRSGRNLGAAGRTEGIFLWLAAGRQGLLVIWLLILVPLRVISPSAAERSHQASQLAQQTFFLIMTSAVMGISVRVSTA